LRYRLYFAAGRPLVPQRALLAGDFVRYLPRTVGDAHFDSAPGTELCKSQVQRENPPSWPSLDGPAKSLTTRVLAKTLKSFDPSKIFQKILQTRQKTLQKIPKRCFSYRDGMAV